MYYVDTSFRGAPMSTALTVKQVAERLNVNERTVYRLAQAGKLPGFKVAGAWRFLEEDLASWISKQKQEATGERGGSSEEAK